MGAFATSNPTGGSDITGSGTANQAAFFSAPRTITVPTRNFTATSTGFVIGSTTEETAGLLTLTSTTQGLIIPRMTTAQSNLITSPVAGLMVFSSSADTIRVYTSGGGTPAWQFLVTSALMPVSYARGDLLYANSTTTLSRLAAVEAGKYLRSEGVGADPVWSTLILPNSASVNQIIHSTASNTWGGAANFLFDTVNVGLIVGETALAATSDIAHFEKNQNAATSFRIHNTTTGASAQTFLQLSDGTDGFNLGFTNTSYSAGTFSAKTAYLQGTGTGGMFLLASNAAGQIQFTTGGATVRGKITSAGSWVLANAALATTATDGFTYIPTCAGTPTGVPTSQTGTVAMIYDTTNNKFYIYNAGWKGGTAPGTFS